MPPRRGIQLRQVRGADQSVYELADPGALEAIRDKLRPSEYDAALQLRALWSSGTMNPEPTSSPIASIGLGRGSGFPNGQDDDRCEHQDRLRTALRAMGTQGMAGRLAVDVAVYDRRLRTADELDALRQALGRLAAHLAEKRLIRRYGLPAPTPLS